MTAALPLREGVGRQVDYWLTVARRTWRGSVVSSFLSPLLYVVAMGVVLGGFIDGDPDQLEGAPSYLAFVVPGLIASHAMQTAVGETTHPVMSMIKWQRVYDSMLATPLQVPHVVAAHLGFVLFRLVATCAVFTLVLAPFGVFETWWGAVLALLAQVLVGFCFATLVYGVSARLRNEEGFGVIFRLGVFPLFLFSGAFFPVTNLGEVGAWVARLTPLWHGVNLSRMFALDHITWWVAGVNVLVLVVLTVLGWFWSVSGLAKRMAS
ncbi:ABC transporter permease [Nocardioides pantholopis]|uniref:ABC transporter permease n=1 Tax=Nocardioides pantholopis TaxID=2483798 RepID=UPI000F0782AB|nr:ABC transporter permease [Nocardioides pantholopis]